MESLIRVCKGYWGFTPHKIEEIYKARYIGDFEIRDKNGNWAEKPVSVFYQENPDIKKGHSHYFGLFKRDLDVFITGANSAFEQPLIGAVADNGEIIISCYRHDYVVSQDGSVMIDGGKSYIRTNTSNLVKIRIEKDKFIIDGPLTLENTNPSTQTEN